MNKERKEEIKNCDHDWSENVANETQTRCLIQSYVCRKCHCVKTNQIK
jgi:hypothetical protein